MLNVCLICSALLTVIFVITVFFSFFYVSTILVNKDNQKPKWVFLLKHLTLVFTTLHLYSDISHEPFSYTV